MDNAIALGQTGAPRSDAHEPDGYEQGIINFFRTELTKLEEWFAKAQSTERNIRAKIDIQRDEDSLDQALRTAKTKILQHQGEEFDALIRSRKAERTALQQLSIFKIRNK